jgi:hypothetical protein
MAFPELRSEFGACGGIGDSLVSAANTSVAVFCRGIEHPIPGTNIPLGSIGAQHCDAWVKLGGILYSISGGPIPPDGANQHLRMWVSQASQQPTGFIQFYVHGAASLGLANCLFESAWNMQSSSQSPAYHPVEGPNSNTLLNQVFHGCGTELGLHTHGTNF